MNPRRLLAALLPVVALAAAACGGAAPAPGPTSAPTAARPVELQVYAAASLKKVLATAAAAYTAATGGVTLAVSTDSSAALETKIEQGAPADVLLSADVKNPQELVDAGLAAGSVVTFATNSLALIVPTANPASITSPVDLARPGVKIVACADSVPIAGYTATLLGNLARTTGYPADFVATVTANVVSHEDNVGAIVAKIALGEGDAGVVYRTDAAGSGDVAVVAIPDSATVRATYGGVVVKASAHADAAVAFLAWLAGPDGQAILAAAGFLPAQ